MIDFISSLFSVGQSIYITQSNDIEIGGKIVGLNNDFIVIQSADGNVIGVRDEAIKSFSKEPIKKLSMPVEQEGLNNRSLTKVGYGVPRRGQSIQKEFFSEPSRYNNKHSFKQYKPGDKIPIESLAKRDPSLANTWRRSEQDKQRLRELREYVRAVYDEIINNGEELEKEVPAIGSIVDLKPGYQFGFIDDVETGERYFYNRGDIVDSELLNMAGEGIKVVYFRGTNHKGPAAKSIHRPNTIGALMAIAMDLVNEDDFIRAKMVLQNILHAYPDNRSASLLLEELMAQVDNGAVGGSGHDNNLYNQARRALEVKDYDSALKLYQECIDKGVRKVNSIKELAQVYISLHSQEKDEVRKELYRKKGLEFIESYKSELPDKPSTNFSLENIYFALGDYQKHIEVVEDIIAESGKNGDLAQYVFYLNKAAQSYLRQNELDKALDAANQGLEVEADNVHLCKTKLAIEAALAGKDPLEEATESNKKGSSFFGLFS